MPDFPAKTTGTRTRRGKARRYIKPLHTTRALGAWLFYGVGALVAAPMMWSFAGHTAYCTLIFPQHFLYFLPEPQ
jgi:hypothetical protein